VDPARIHFLLGHGRELCRRAACLCLRGDARLARRHHRSLEHLGLNIYPAFSLQGLFGAALVYAYFQFPLMILLMVPVIEGLRTEWRESASNLGAGAFTFWRHIGLPIITRRSSG